MRRMRALLLSIGLGAALAALVLAPVSASYPGQHNGRIAFGIRRDDGANIFAVLPDGTGQKQLTKDSRFHFCPSYSPDGRHHRLLRQRERSLGDLDYARRTGRISAS